MKTVNYPCGCSITYSMFGENEILSIRSCYIHSTHNDIKDILKILESALFSVIKEENKITKIN